MSYTDHFLLNKTISFYSVTNTPNGKGGVTTTKALVKSVKGAFWRNGSVEVWRSQQWQTPATHTIAIKPDSTIRPTYVAVVDGTTYTLTKPEDVNNESDLMIIGAEVRK